MNRKKRKITYDFNKILKKPQYFTLNKIRQSNLDTPVESAIIPDFLPIHYLWDNNTIYRRIQKPLIGTQFTRTKLTKAQWLGLVKKTDLSQPGFLGFKDTTKIFPFIDQLFSRKKFTFFNEIITYEETRKLLKPYLFLPQDHNSGYVLDYCLEKDLETNYKEPLYNKKQIFNILNSIEDPDTGNNIFMNILKAKKRTELSLTKKEIEKYIEKFNITEQSLDYLLIHMLSQPNPNSLHYTQILMDLGSNPTYKNENKLNAFEMAVVYNEKCAEYILQQPIYYNSERNISEEIAFIEQFNSDFKPVYENMTLQGQQKINKANNKQRIL